MVHLECATPGPGPECRSCAPGHLPHPLHAHLLRRTPWGWRSGRVASVAPDGWLTVRCSDDPAAFRAWHHQDLTGHLALGQPVRVHERHCALATGLGVLSLHIEEGPVPVPEPVPLDRWATGSLAPVLDLSTGAPLPLAPGAGDR